MTTVNKVTINVPVADAEEATRVLSQLVECEVVIEDGSRYALLTLGGVRIAFVSGQEDIAGGDVALALEVADAAAVTSSAEAAGIPTHRAEHASSRTFHVARMPGAAALVYYQK